LRSPDSLWMCLHVCLCRLSNFQTTWPNSANVGMNIVPLVVTPTQRFLISLLINILNLFIYLLHVQSSLNFGTELAGLTVALKMFIREVLCSKLGWDTGYPDHEIFYSFLQPFWENAGTARPLDRNLFLPNPFQFIIHWVISSFQIPSNSSFTHHRTIRCYMT
jgi:hypothetical protein